jgi:hypothetical protein
MWEIYAYQNADSLFGIFNAAATIHGSGDYMAAVAAVAFCGFIAALVAYAFAPEKLQGWKWLATVLLVFSVLIVPRVTVGVVDKTGGCLHRAGLRRHCTGGVVHLPALDAAPGRLGLMIALLAIFKPIQALLSSISPKVWLAIGVVVAMLWMAHSTRVAKESLHKAEAAAAADEARALRESITETERRVAAHQEIASAAQAQAQAQARVAAAARATAARVSDAAAAFAARVWKGCMSSTGVERWGRRRLGAWAAEGVEAKRAKTEYRWGAPTSPGPAPWAQEVIPGGAGFSRVAADDLLPPTFLGRRPPDMMAPRASAPPCRLRKPG